MLKQLYHRWMPVTFLVVIGMSLAGCVTTEFITVDAFCKTLPQTDRAIQGRTVTDRKWIAGTQEAEISGCNFPRPLPAPHQPPSRVTKRQDRLVPLPPAATAQQAPEALPVPPQQPPAAKPSLVESLRARIQHAQDQLKALEHGGK